MAWEEWSLDVLQMEKGDLIINVDQLKTCYSFLYRISSLFTKVVLDGLFPFFRHDLLNGTP
jgi:hypothetical protein